MVDDAFLERERAHARPLARVRGLVGSGHGCEGGGPYWEWLTTLPEPGPLDESTLNAIAADDPFELAEPMAAETHAQGDGA